MGIQQIQIFKAVTYKIVWILINVSYCSGDFIYIE